MNEEKRDRIFHEISERLDPVLISVANFFEGNEYDASIGRCLNPHPGIGTFKTIFEKLQQRPDVSGIYMLVADANPALDWPFTDTVYITGNISTEELSTFLAPLQPDEVGNIAEFDYEVPEAILEKHPEEKIQLVWWDS